MSLFARSLELHRFILHAFSSSRSYAFIPVLPRPWVQIQPNQMVPLPTRAHLVDQRPLLWSPHSDLTNVLASNTVLYINENVCRWPSGFKLDIDLDNWEEWSLEISWKAAQRGFTEWLNGSYPQPSATTHANEHRIWAINDRSLKDFILSHVSQNDYRSVSHLPTSHAVFEELRKTHTKQGLCARMVLIKKAMEIRFRPDIPLSGTVDEIYALHTYQNRQHGPDRRRRRALFDLPSQRFK